MDPIIAGIVIVLGKYALDKGAEIAPQIGRQALDTVERLFKLVINRISSKGQEGEVIAKGFEKDPKTFDKPLAKMLDTEMRADADFAAKVRKLVDEYDHSVDAHSGGDEYKISIGGSVSGVGVVVGGGKVSAGRDIVGGTKERQEES